MAIKISNLNKNFKCFIIFCLLRNSIIINDINFIICIISI